MTTHNATSYEFPGRMFVFRHPDAEDWQSVAAAALAAIEIVVEPSVVEVETDRSERIWHLVANGSAGGTYVRDPTRTRAVPRIDGPTLQDWFETVARDEPIVTLSIADGWFRVDADPSDRLRVKRGIGHDEIVLEEHHGEAMLLAPTRAQIDAPVRFTLDLEAMALRVGVQWSAWLDAGGIGRERIDAMCRVLATNGWELVERPLVESSAVEQSPSIAAMPLPRTPPAPADRWIQVAAGVCVLGLDGEEFERLVAELLRVDKLTFDDEPSLGWREYDGARRLREIRAGLAASRGRIALDVAPYAIMRTPVTRAMWRDYAASTNARSPAATGSDDDPVTGISVDDAMAFAAHHGWRLPAEAEWQLAIECGAFAFGPTEFTRDPFRAYGAEQHALFEAHFGDVSALACARGHSPRVPPCSVARFGVARDRPQKFMTFRCVRHP